MVRRDKNRIMQAKCSKDVAAAIFSTYFHNFFIIGCCYLCATRRTELPQPTAGNVSASLSGLCSPLAARQESLRKITHPHTHSHTHTHRLMDEDYLLARIPLCLCGVFVHLDATMCK